MGVGIHHAWDAAPLVQKLEPVDDGVVISSSIRLDGEPAKDLVRRMDLDHVDVPVHSREPVVPLAITVAIAEHPAHVGMVHLDELVAGPVPESQPLDLYLGVLVGYGSAAILSVGPHDHGERILMIERQRLAGHLDSHTGGHPLFGPQQFQMRIVGREPVMFRARGEFDVLAK
jgi:hypothetical protein